MKNNKKIILSIVGVLISILVIVGISYAYFTSGVGGNKSLVSVSTANGALTIDEDKIEVNNAMPIYDSQKDTKANINEFTISLAKNNNNDACIDVYLVIDKLGNNLKNKWFKYEISNGEETKTGTFENVGEKILLFNSQALLKKTSPSKTYTLKIWLSYDEEEDQSFILQGSEEDRTFEGHIYASGENGECDKQFLKKLLADNPTVKTRDSFDAIFTENTANTIYKATGENDKDVYYFAGGETESLKINNWVMFGQDKDGNNLYWRIIRTNEDGGVRLLYAGSSNSTEPGVPTMENAYIGISAYNSAINNSMYVGYMYGISGSLTSNRKNTKNSTIKGVIDTWYNSGLNTKTDGTNTYDKYISKGAVYCNDRAHSGTYYATGTSMYYAGYERLARNSTTKVEPTYVCGKDTNTGTALNTSSITSGSEDKFSASTSQGGNGKLQYPVALMTADEVSYAGGLYETNHGTAWYYYNVALASTTGSTKWWTMSPYLFNGGRVFMFGVNGSSDPGQLKYNLVNGTYGVRPVISLKSCVRVKPETDGSVEHPYEVEVSESCALKDEAEPKVPETLKEQILADNPTVSTRDSFTDIFTENTPNTIYKATGEDGETDVYYFAGGETESLKINNWVKFGKDSSGNNLYWRIIRTNADGGVRLLYAGSSNSTSSGVPTMTNAVINTSTAYNSTNNNSMYVGYMYGTTGNLANNRKNTTSSTIKGVIDTWYEQGLNAKSDGINTYDKYISKGAIYCNDRAHSGTYYATGTTMNYVGYERLVRNRTTKAQPTYVCGKDTGAGTALNTSSITSGSEDKFSASTSQGGNGKLQYPIALMTADEVSYAGGLYATNHGSVWYYYNAAMASATGSTWWWTMGPYSFSSSNNYAGAFFVVGPSNPGRLGYTSVSVTGGVRPVVSLKSCVKAKEGTDGSVEHPYEVEISEECALEEEPKTLSDQILADNPTVKTRDTFTSIFTENTANTLYKATGEDGKSDVYYFAGGETESLKINNWVKFGQDSSGNNLYWRIIRTNANGGVRLLYAGSSNSTEPGVPTMENAYIGTSVYNSTATNSMYVGYMYGTTGSLANNRKNTTSSTIKGVIDTWYNSGLNKKTDGINEYNAYISKGTIYCNDRAHSGTYLATGAQPTSTMYYATYERLVRNRSTKAEPTYVCGKDTGAGTALNTSSITSGSEDKFSSSTSQGRNGKLQYPVALMTADEVSYAGGAYTVNNQTVWYYHNAALGSATGGRSWWTMSPYIFNNGNTLVFAVTGSSYPGRLYHASVDGTNGVRPVVSLKSCVTVTGGNGSVASPYTIGLNGSCATSDE